MLRTTRLGLAVTSVLALALTGSCTGGGDATSSGGSSSSSSSGTSGSSGSSGLVDSGARTECTEFAIPAKIDEAIGGSLVSRAIVQAVSDYAESAANEVDQATQLCKKLAQDLDASPTDQASADNAADTRAKLKAWCALAALSLNAKKAQAGGALSTQAATTRCRLSVAEKGSCQAACTGSPCDVKANPMKCTGGSLLISCKGDCSAVASASVTCEGTCNGTCGGACTVASGSVECTGTCTGTCSASGTGTGTQPDGSCKGACSGTCSAVAPGGSCSGVCKGACTGSCAGSAQAPVTCDGACSGDFEPLYCESGKLEGGCQVDARCDVGCDATVAAKATCPGPSVLVSVSGATDDTAAAKLKAAIESSFGALLMHEEHLKVMANIGPQLASAVSSVTDIKPSCIPKIISAVSTAVGDVQAGASSVSSVTSNAGL